MPACKAGISVNLNISRQQADFTPAGRLGIFSITRTFLRFSHAKATNLALVRTGIAPYLLDFATGANSGLRYLFIEMGRNHVFFLHT